MRASFTTAVLLIASVLCLASAGDGTWRTHVSEKDRAKENPYREDPTARIAGAKLFQLHCAECHGENGMGDKRHPAVVSGRIRHTSDGELHWLLRNGSLWNGMPSWSSLPEPQRWQLITYLRSIQQ
jgi:mono/diheme cytochrome c family protein